MQFILEPLDICNMVPDYGACPPVTAQDHTAAEFRYFYNNVTQTCDIMKYSGCGGNENNFKSKEECLGLCERKCPKNMCQCMANNKKTCAEKGKGSTCSCKETGTTCVSGLCCCNDKPLRSNNWFIPEYNS